MSSEKILKSNHFIRFSDCDPLGHLFNVKYLNYFLDAREDQVRNAYNLNMQEMAEKHHWALLVGTHQISYLHPASCNEKVSITSAIIDSTDKWVIVEFLMVDQNGKAKAFMWTTFISYNIALKKSAPIPREMRDLINTHLVPKPATDFHSRFLQLRKAI